MAVSECRTGGQAVRDGRQGGETEQLTEVITLAFISIKMSPRRRN